MNRPERQYDEALEVFRRLVTIMTRKKVVEKMLADDKKLSAISFVEHTKRK